jgi:SpoVK/Ycf46/Vps4 family AAA+-type ATPase
MLDYRCKAPDDSRSNLSIDKLYKTIHYRSIKEHSLFYSSNTQKFHLDITQIAKKIDKSEGICILLSGASGTGKTLFAHQLAKEIKGTIIQLSFPQIQSKYIGETEKNIQLAFEAYNSRWTRKKSPTILLLNEADGLMNKRVDIKTSNDIFSNHAQTELLEQLENFKGILIATTNMANNMDSAFKRRFLFQMEIKHPDSIAREKYLLQSKLRKYLTQKQIKELSETHWTIAEIQKIEKQMELISRIRTVDKSDLTNLLTQEGHYANKYFKIGYR